jgi:L-cysteine:1D-myo-inositol 2-amino-2-deoxy-alpha-D-glucopyranoside ligase
VCVDRLLGVESWPAVDVPRLPGSGLPLRVMDTSAREVRPLRPGPRATTYVCGITPYDATHMGHAATYLAFDTLHRVLRDGGTEVDFCENVTDIDDPLLERAQRDAVDWVALAERETALFRADMAALRILPPRWYVGAVEAIPEIADLVLRLRDAGAAYDVDDDVYFSVSASPHFGAVSNCEVETMRRLAAQRGGDPDRAGKKDPLDPVLWRAARPGEPSWDSPLGPGRPGWHVECAAIALGRLGTTLDVQGGGSDLAFPHHEMTAAHATVATGEWPFARAFVHAGMVGLDGEKMSKSRGNLVFVSRLRDAGVEPAAIRLAVLAHHYRDDWEWTDAGLAAAQRRLAAWRLAVRRPAGPPADALLADVRRRLADDLDTPHALERVDGWVDEAHAAGGDDPTAPGLVRDVVDALLGVAL